MNQDPTPRWLESMSAGPAPGIPASVLTALAARRRERRAVLAASFGGVLMLAIAIGLGWMAMQPKRPAAIPPPAPIAELHRPLDRTDDRPARVAAVTVASIYGNDLDLERLASASPASVDRRIRIGDHWDPEQVRAWVLD